MKKLKSSLAAKVAASLLLVVLAVGMLYSAIGIGIMYEKGAYSGAGLAQVQERYLKPWCVSNMYNLMERYRYGELPENLDTISGMGFEIYDEKDRLVYARDQVGNTFKKVFPYILIGVGIGAVIHNWIPERWIQTILGSRNPLGVLLAVIVGIPMYADIFGTIPVAEALLAKGALLGTILSFMMAVTTLSLPSMIMLRKAVKPTLLGLFTAICTIGIVIVGYFFNAIQCFLV